jgi:CubicO group peptidase (beta-lactamase class C family)
MTALRSPLRLVLSWLLLCGTVPPALAQDVEAEAEAEEAIQAVLAEHYEADGPGAAVAVLQGGELLAASFIGLADIDAEIPIDADTVFDLASVSKQFTATAVLKLAGEGKLDVRKPLSVYVPDFEVRSPVRQVRVADLIFHTSGLADYTSEDWEGSDEDFSALTTEDHLDWINQTEAEEPPGVNFAYNNSGYVLLALVVERVSGQRFHDFVRSRFFVPAGMRATAVMTDAKRRFPRQATGYFRNDDGSVEPSYDPSVVAGDGNVFSSLNDMIAWMRMLDHTRLLNPPQRRTLWARGLLDNGKPAESEGSGYGYGWFIEDGGRVAHSGSWRGTATYVLRDNPNQLSVIVLSNDENSDVGAVAEALAALALAE